VTACLDQHPKIIMFGWRIVRAGNNGMAGARIAAFIGMASTAHTLYWRGAGCVGVSGTSTYAIERAATVTEERRPVSAAKLNMLKNVASAVCTVAALG